MPAEERPRARRRRRAVGPPGSRPGSEAALDVVEVPDEPAPDDDERLLREVPPHHG